MKRLAQTNAVNSLKSSIFGDLGIMFCLLVKYSKKINFLKFAKFNNCSKCAFVK